MPNMHKLLDEAQTQCQKLVDEIKRLKDVRELNQKAADDVKATRKSLIKEVNDSVCVLQDRVNSSVDALNAGVLESLEETNALLKKATDAVRPFSHMNFMRILIFIAATSLLNVLLFLVILFAK